jgi:hypothetical protein
MRGDARKTPPLNGGDGVIIARNEKLCRVFPESQANEVFAVVFQFVNGFVHIGQRGVPLLLFEG